MDMSVNKIAGGIAVQQVSKALKPLVGKILPVVEMPGGRMGQKDIKAFLAPEGKGQSADAPVHFLLGILVGAWFVAHRASKTQYAHAFKFVDLSVDAGTSFWRSLMIAVIMISVYIQYRPLEKSGKERQVLRMQIPAGEDQIDPLQFAFVEIIPQPGGFFVCEYHNLHSCSLCSWYFPMPCRRTIRLASSVMEEMDGKEPWILSRSQSMEPICSGGIVMPSAF